MSTTDKLVLTLPSPFLLELKFLLLLFSSQWTSKPITGIYYSSLATIPLHPSTSSNLLARLSTKLSSFAQPVILTLIGILLTKPLGIDILGNPPKLPITK